jgi:hypothetical protein
MKTLVIHPKDKSTTFLDAIYAKLENKTVVQGGLNNKQLDELIVSHERILMMGHGSPSGLFGVGQFGGYMGMVIDNSSTELLRPKTENVFIWCNADMYIRPRQLQGFFSGMFISEVSEATVMGLPGMPQELVDESNYGFAEILGDCINNSKEEIYKEVKEKYFKIAENNPVAYYNWLRIYKT